MYPEIMKKKERYLEHGGVRCLHCEDHNITGGHVTITGHGATQEVSCNNCGSSWTDYYKIDTAFGIEIHNDHLKEDADGMDKQETS